MTLWDLLKFDRRKPREERLRAERQGAERQPAGRGRAARAPRRGPSMRDKYESVSRRLLAEHGIRVRKWRTSMSGIAWEVRYRDGSVSRFIESPRPTGPVSVAIFLHEIGHHAIGFDRFKPRCLEEYHAWAYALAKMEELDLNITDAVHKRVRDSLRYAVDKARRRGLKRVPEELHAYCGRERH